MSKIIKILFKIFTVIILIVSVVSFPLISILLKEQHDQDEFEKVVHKDEI